MYAHFAADGISNRLGDLSEIAAAVPANCTVQVIPDIGRYEVPFHEHVDFITFLYAERSRIVDFQTIVVFASHNNTSFDGALHGVIISHRNRKIHGHDTGPDAEAPAFRKASDSETGETFTCHLPLHLSHE